MLQAFTTQASGTTFQPAQEPICTEGIDNTICRVMNNEVVAITAPQSTEGMISWTVNGKPYHCDASISSACSDTQNTQTIILPMRGSIGDLITVSAHTQKVDITTNQKADISRVFRITDPSVSIIATSGAVPRVLGSYENLDDDSNTFLDESQSALTATSSTITLTADLYPNFQQT